MTEIKAIILDADGVSFRKISPLVDKKLSQLAHVSEEIVKEKRKKYWALTKIGTLTSKEMWFGSIHHSGFEKGILGELGVKEKEFTTQDLFEMNSGAIEFLKDTKKQEIPLCLLSNSSEDLIEKQYHYFKLETFFTATFFSHKMKIAKPDQRVFEKVLKELPFDPAEILFVDDKEKILFAAEELGFQTFLFTESADFVKIKRMLSTKQKLSVLETSL